MTPIPAEPAHFPEILALNARSVEVLSPLDAARLVQLHAHAAYHQVVLIEGQVAAFLLAFAPGAPYDSPNYQWFVEHESNFLYVDRIVVAESARGRGLATRLYRDLFAVAAARGHACVVCEYDLDPPNPASAAFHQRFGFVEVGTQRVARGTKAVSLQRAAVPRPQPAAG